MNNRQIAARLDAADAAAAAAQVATNVTLKFFRRDVFDFHDRLKQNRFALLKAVFHGENRCQLESELAGIDFVKPPVTDIDFNIDNWITSKTAVQHSFVNALFNCGNVFARNTSPDD